MTTRQLFLLGAVALLLVALVLSLELGGHPTDPRNLWPEPYPRASAVDQTENDLNAKVCGGSLSLRGAQEQESALKHSVG